MHQRIVIHTDLDYFYAQCEETAHPELRGRPIVVCVYSGRTLESGVVSTSNYEARKYGVKAAMPITRAKKLLEKTNASFLPMNRPLYEEVSCRIMDRMRIRGDSFEQVGIDEAFLDVSELTEGNFEKARIVALQMKEEIIRHERVSCSIGVAPNKLLAKMASDYNKPNGLTIIEQENVTRFIAEQPTNNLPGVGRKVEEKLNELRVKTIRELASVDPIILIEKFGKSLGSYLYLAARGEDDDPVKDREQPTQLSRIGTLKQNTRNPQEILPLIRDLVDDVFKKLDENAMEYRSVTVIAILTDLSIHSKSMTLESPTRDKNMITETSKTLLERFLKTNSDAVIRRVGVKLSGLSKRTGQTDIVKFLHA